MKQFFTLLALLLAAYCSDAQPLQAYAGMDTVICPGPPITALKYPRLGAPATGGVPPYTYLWTAINDPAFASIVDHPDSARPYANGILYNITTPPDSVVLTVRVTDSVGTVARDTVTVYIARWRYLALSCRRSQSGADTVHFSGSTKFWSNFGPFTNIRWNPSVYLSDSTVDDPKCWAPPGRTFVKYGTDRVGCRSEIGSCGTYALPNATLDAQSTPKGVARIVPSPATQASRIEISADLVGAQLRIFSPDGRCVHNATLIQPSTPLHAGWAAPRGAYFYSLWKEGRRAHGGTFTVQ